MPACKTSPRISHIELTTSIMSLMAIIVSSVTYNVVMHMYGPQSAMESNSPIDENSHRNVGCWVSLSMVGTFVFVLIMGLIGAARKNLCLLRFFWVVMTLKVVVSLSLAFFALIVTFVLIPRGLIPAQWVPEIPEDQTANMITEVRNNPVPFVGQLVLAFLSFVLQLRCIAHSRALITHILESYQASDEVELNQFSTSSDDDMVFEPRPVAAHNPYMVPQGVYAQHDGNVYLLPVDSANLVPVYVDRSGHYTN
eukprot:TRINITY_DN10315_c0_g1_i1.p1 TRINITY_DN10315_c0_g1~~TRINITY_DN10315_c0_g1_i1.p1  ORF type:complete len:261 (-),score=43.79 TRINITY_DN10315_c0_g1_i1:72-830(-)